MQGNGEIGGDGAEGGRLVKFYHKSIWTCCAVLALGACSEQNSSSIESEGNSGKVTLYRNSELLRTMRIHFATFDAPESEAFNYANCQMAARLLNANVKAVMESNGSEAEPSVGFWCELGTMQEDEPVPASFDSEYPTEV